MNKKTYFLWALLIFLIAWNIFTWFFVIEKQKWNQAETQKIPFDMNNLSTIIIQKPFFVNISEKIIPFQLKEIKNCWENQKLWTNKTYWFEMCIGNDWSSYSDYQGRKIPLSDTNSNLAKISPIDETQYLSNMDIQNWNNNLTRDIWYITQVGEKTFIEYYVFDENEKKYYYRDNVVYFEKNGKIISITFDKTFPEQLDMIQTLQIIQ